MNKLLGVSDLMKTKMRLEVFLAGICLFLSAFNIYVLSVFALHGKITNLPGAEFYRTTINALNKKYPTKLYPPRALVLVTWLIVLISNFISAFALFLSSSRGRKVFSANAYIAWMIQMIGTAAWTFSFDQEHHTYSLFILIVEVLSYCSLMSSVCSRSAEKVSKDERYPIPDGSRWWFNGIVLTSLGILGSWIFISLAATANFALSYENSADFSSAKQRGICSFENCASICLLTTIVLYLGWTFIDLIFYPSHTESVKSFYPSMFIFGLGYFLSNYNPTSGLTTSNLMCLGLSLTSLTTWILRPYLACYRPEESIGNKSKSD